MANDRRVLIVEDDPFIAHLLCVLVEDAGAQPLVTYDGREALAVARESPPALVITDLLMPVMDGHALIRALRQDVADRRSKMPPVVLVTAAGLPTGENACADVLLRKPFDLAELDEVLARFLGHGSARHARHQGV